MEIEAQSIEYESPRIVDYGDFAAVTAAALHDPMHPDPLSPHDPHLNHSA